MTFAKYLGVAVCALVLAPAYADTTTTNRASKAEVERKASPAAPKTDEERTQTHSQPEVPTPTDKAGAFRSLDVDGDGLVSKSEAAGNEEVTLAFDRGDRNRDGKLSVAEYERYGKAKAKAAAKAKGRQTAARKGEGSASAGGTKAGKKEK